MVPLTTYMTCGHRYLNGDAPAGTPKCAYCALLSLDECIECGRYVCRDHGQGPGGLCQACVRLVADRAVAAKRQSFEDSVVPHLEAHPIARLCQVMRMAQPSIDTGSRKVWIRNRAVVRRFLPDGRFAISDTEIAEWFAGLCQMPPVDIPLVLEASRFTRQPKKQRFIHGWQFMRGSTRFTAPDKNSSMRWFLDAAISADGRRLYRAYSHGGYQVEEPASNEQLRGADRLNAVCLAEMATMVSLSPLPDAGIDDPGEDDFAEDALG